MAQSKSPDESNGLRERVGELITLLHGLEPDADPAEALPDLRCLHDEIDRWIEAGETADTSWIERLRHHLEQIKIDHPQAVPKGK